MVQRRMVFLAVVRSRSSTNWLAFCCRLVWIVRADRDTYRARANGRDKHAGGIRHCTHPSSPQNRGRTSLGRERSHRGAPRGVIVHPRARRRLRTHRHGGGRRPLPDHRGLPVRRAPAARELVRASIGSGPNGKSSKERGVYAVPTKPMRGESLALVVKFSRVGERVPIDTQLIENVLCCEFNGPFEEFALVEELRHSRRGRRICGSRPRCPSRSTFRPSEYSPLRADASSGGSPARSPSTRESPSTSCGSTSWSTAGFRVSTRGRRRRWGSCPNEARALTERARTRSAPRVSASWT